MEELDLTDAVAAREGSSWDNMKFPFDEDGKTIEIKLYYAPFPWQSK